MVHYDSLQEGQRVDFETAQNPRDHRERAARDEPAHLAELDRLRAEFVSSVTHELRTPITAARAGIGLVLARSAQQLDEPARRLLRNAQRNVGRLAVLIDDLLAYSQVASGTLRLEHVPLDLREVAEDVATSIQPLVDEKEHTLALDLLLPLEVRGDAHRLEQVLINLLSNAHIHTPEGTRIAASGRTTATGVSVSVSDDGPGLPPEVIERVFDRFFRHGATGGSGLGLAIARDRQAAQRHAPRRGGARFVLELPAPSYDSAEPDGTDGTNR